LLLDLAVFHGLFPLLNSAAVFHGCKFAVPPVCDRSDKDDFLLAIKENRQTLEPLETAHRACSICQLGLIAVKIGSPLKWDPVKEDFIGDNAASAMLDIPIREKYFKF